MQQQHDNRQSTNSRDRIEEHELQTSEQPGAANDERTAKSTDAHGPEELIEESSDIRTQTQWQKLRPALISGSAVFADGYLTMIMGPVGTMLEAKYGPAFKNGPFSSTIRAVTFAGTVMGQIVFGIVSDRWSRRKALLVSTVMIAVFALLSAVGYGRAGDMSRTMEAMTAWRFLLGIGIGGGFSAGSVSCSETTMRLSKRVQNLWFIVCTNTMINLGVVAASAVSWATIVAIGVNHLTAAWRVSLGVGVIPPLLLLCLHFGGRKTDELQSEKRRKPKIPLRSAAKLYWKRLLAVSCIWFLYDFSSYGLSIYSSTIISDILEGNKAMATSFAWTTAIFACYLPGTFLGAIAGLWIGPRCALIIGALLQMTVGIIMSLSFGFLANRDHVAVFVVAYGIFLALGEFGAGNYVGVFASKSCATSVRGHYYAVAAASGKTGAFVAVYVIPRIESIGANHRSGRGRYLFALCSVLALLIAVLARCALPNITPASVADEDTRLQRYLEVQVPNATHSNLDADLANRHVVEGPNETMGK